MISLIKHDSSEGSVVIIYLDRYYALRQLKIVMENGPFVDTIPYLT
jgi:hypothetical protein